MSLDLTICHIAPDAIRAGMPRHEIETKLRQIGCTRFQWPEDYVITAWYPRGDAEVFIQVAPFNNITDLMQLQRIRA